MGTFHIDVRLEDGSRRDRHDRIGSLTDACRAAFLLAESLASSTAADDARVRWIDVFDGIHLEISIQVFPGEPMTGPLPR